MYGVSYKPVAEIFDVNQSALERRTVKGMKNSSTCFCDSSLQILFRESTACPVS